MKIRHSDKQWVGKTFLFVGVLLILFLLFCIVRLLLPTVFSGKDVDVIEDDLTYITVQVLDYEEEKKGDPAIWELKYSITKFISELYQNNEKIREINDGSLERIITFLPEDDKGHYDFTKELEENVDTGIIYEFNLKTSKEYVASLLNSGYFLRRKILTSTYAELYLLDTEGNTVRILCFNDKMLMGKLYENTTMPSIESYFN